MYALARGKINWTLETRGLREDNYHLLDMLMQSVEIYDRLDAERANELTLEIDGDIGIDYRDNIVYKAAVMLQKATGTRQGASLRLEKHIPIGAGMGGGSADAAAALLLLMKLWNVTIPAGELSALALRLGADVPFCLRGGLCRVQGIGESVSKYSFAPSVPLVVVQPCAPLSTKEVFSLCNSYGESNNTALAAEAARTHNYARLCALMTNDLEAVSISLRPEISRAKAELENYGAMRAIMTGSGSAVYGAFSLEAAAIECSRQLKSLYPVCFFTKTYSEGVTL
ncbi:MAG: 4-(cytidine 5'-diphospho)-2-C-methyl-D-erythritol kinase [Eubacteriales bacterium]|nr:4-(cytidine 5'-diphospho)-2-C-methyl-D-erythritol kinase [Eubacteriales bacterium]MDD3881521.1 4-(cytidine 5'-diphospho)-2-C-methyl-D-erythritol kinase [Eubacteriales bacterium]MDD4512997.1 4-(cytidine 5'-diphospho)-2-C-methyl-D-erythritol kinase [Eubacteriales bacterium]